jgi:alkanesulfonate monooxygenase SsuD/methylene tetrahydromethanopterin reductase-like flavin-dependent oxidoreductase (luciferase family)
LKRIGFLSFGHWGGSTASQTCSAADSLLQSIELAVAAEELGADGAYFRVHHFAKQISSPFPLLAAIAAKTSRIEIGTAVIDMRYENPHYMAELAAATDLIASGRLQLGIGRGSPEHVVDGWRHFGHLPQAGENGGDMARRHADLLFDLLRGQRFAEPNELPMLPNAGSSIPNATSQSHDEPALLRLEPHSEGLRDRLWWGSSSYAWAAKQGANLQTSTVMNDETGEPFHIQQAAQIRAFRAAWKEAGHTRKPRVAVVRTIFAITNDRDRENFGYRVGEEDKFGLVGPAALVFGRSYIGEPDSLVELLRQDEAVAEADTVLLTSPNELGVAYNAHLIEAVLTHVAPALGWRERARVPV